jgi:hypothetical protein
VEGLPLLLLLLLELLLAGTGHVCGEEGKKRRRAVATNQRNKTQNRRPKIPRVGLMITMMEHV